MLKQMSAVLLILFLFTNCKPEHKADELKGNTPIQDTLPLPNWGAEIRKQNGWPLMPEQNLRHTFAPPSLPHNTFPVKLLYSDPLTHSIRTLEVWDTTLLQ